MLISRRIVTRYVWECGHNHRILEYRTIEMGKACRRTRAAHKQAWAALLREYRAKRNS